MNPEWIKAALSCLVAAAAWAGMKELVAHKRAGLEDRPGGFRPGRFAGRTAMAFALFMAALAFLTMMGLTSLSQK